MMIVFSYLRKFEILPTKIDIFCETPLPFSKKCLYLPLEKTIHNMKTKFVILFLLTLLFVVNCTNKGNAAQKSNIDAKSDTTVFVEKAIEITEIKSIDLTEQYEEDFRIFLEKFGTDSLFQVSRIVFPLQGVEFDWDYFGNGQWFINTDRNYYFTRDIENHRFLTLFRIKDVVDDVYAAIAYADERAYFNDYILIRTITRIADDEYFVDFDWFEICGRSGYHFRKNENGKWYLVKLDYRSM